MRTRELVFCVGLAASLSAIPACAPPVDLSKNLQVVDVATGWSDAGITEDGQNKLVPFVTFKLKNNSSRSLPVLRRTRGGVPSLFPAAPFWVISCRA